MKVLLDTNVWITFFRNPALRAEFEHYAKRPSVYISSVVALELFAGCRTRREAAELDSFLKPFEKGDRVLAPDHASFRQAGAVVAALARDGIAAAQRRLLINDVLIAVTAVKSGAVLVTANRSDFSRIAKHMPLRWIPPVRSPA